MTKIYKKKKEGKNKMNKKSILTAVVMLTFIVGNIFSASGTSGVAFIKVSPSARVSGMAEAFVGVADDSSAVWYNPAGLANIAKLSVGGSYGMLFEGLNFQYVSFAYPMKGQGTVGVNVMLSDYGSIKGYDSSGNLTKNFSAKDMVVAGGYAMNIQPGLGVGGVVKMVQSTIEAKSNSAISLDIGGIYKLDANTALGVALKNVIGTIKYDQEQVKLPMLIKLGGSYNVGHLAGNVDKLSILADVTMDQEAGTIIQPAVEYLYPMGGADIMVRAGYKVGGVPSGAGLTAGVSVKLQGQYRIDVAYTPLADLGNAIRVGLELQF